MFNVRRKIQGWCDSPLTPLGIAQAKVAEAYFKDHDITFDHAYASTSERACDTLEIITSQPYTRVKGLKEWNFGTFEGESEDLNPKLPYGDFFVAMEEKEKCSYVKEYLKHCSILCVRMIITVYLLYHMVPAVVSLCVHGSIHLLSMSKSVYTIVVY